MRVDLYSLIHKAQRKHLFDLSFKIGRTDFRDASQISVLKEEIKAIIIHLYKHAKVEETFIHPLFKKIGGQGDVIEEEHRDLETLLGDLEKSLLAENQENLYTRFNQFLIAYLSHIDAEETAQKDILWKHYDDSTLMDVLKRFQESRTPDQSMDDLKFILPCLNPQETEKILKSMKGSVPDKVYESVEVMAQKASA